MIDRRVRVRPDDFTLLLAALAALGVVLVLAREIVYGVGLYGDSIEYVAVARNMLAGKGLTLIDGTPLKLWPPLYPLLLAGAGLGMIDPLDVAGPLNAAIFGLTIFAVGHYLRQRIDSRFLVVWVCIAAALSIPLADLASWAMTDPAFILLATLALIRTDKFLTESKTSSLVWAGVFSALAWQTRYTGAAVPVVVGLLLLFQPAASPWQRVRRTAGFSLIVGSPMALWLLRNFLLTGGFTPTYRWAIDYSLPAILSDLGDGLRGWFSFELPGFRLLSEGTVPPAVGLLLVAAAVAAVAIAQRKHRRPCYLFGGYALTNLLLLVLAFARGWPHYGIDPRYLIPFHIPLLVIAAFGLDRFLGSERKRNLPRILMVCLCVHVAGQIAPNVREIRRANADDTYAGFNRQPWAGSETLRYLRDNPLRGEVHSNMPHLAFLHNAGEASYRELPRSRLGGYAINTGFREPSSASEQLDGWLAGVADGAYVVWLHDMVTNALFDYGAALMRITSGFEPVAERADGAIFKVNRNHAVGTNPYRSAYESLAAGDYGEPAARSTFDVYLDGRTLTYLKEPCVAGDVRARFFLHVVPAEVADLPAGHKRHVFENMDFTFSNRGVILNGACLAMVKLPGYEIVVIRTGQYRPGEDHIWDETFSPPDRSAPFQ